MSNSYPGGLLTTGADTGYSVAFDGTTDYLTIPNAAWMNLGTSDFTMECWVYFNDVSATQMFVTNNYNAGNGAGGWAFAYRQDNTTLKFSVNSNVAYEKTWSPVANKWYHVAVSRSGSSLRMFVNGTQVGTTSTSTDNISGASSTMWVGSNESTSYAMNGFISSMRITTTALYTTTFTPPTQLFSVPGTQFLSLQNPRFVDVSNNAAVITANGNAAVSNFTPFAGYKGFDPKMGAAAGGVWTLEQATSYQSNRTWPIYDPYFNQTTLLLHGNGANTATNSSFIDSSSNNFTITRNGNATQGSFSPFATNGWSNYFTGGYFTVPNSTSLKPGTGDFTWEAWVYPNSDGGNYFLWAQGADGLDIYRNTSNLLVFDDANVANILTSTNTVPLNKWTHYALTRSGTTTRLFVNGVLDKTGTYSADITNSAATSIGQNWPGYISNTRFVKGTAVYTSNFIPSTTPLTAITGTSLLTCQSNRFVDNSPNNFAITLSTAPSVQAFSPFVPAYITPTTYSNWFDGSSDYLSGIPATVYDFGTSEDFSVEFWTYLSSVPSSFGFTGGNASSDFGFIYDTSAGYLKIQKAAIANILTTTYVLLPNQWYHIVGCRRSGILSIFVNGVRQATVADTTSFASNAGYIGGNTGFASVNGVISNFRVLAGASAYDPSSLGFTPPSAPLTAIANTVVLTCQNSTFIDNSPTPLTITATGNVQPVTSPTPFPAKVDQTTLNSAYSTSLVGGSAYFDGTDDNLSLSSTSLNLSSSDFTIETWIYATTTDVDVIMGSLTYADGLGSWQIQLNYPSTPLRFFCRYSSGTVLDYQVGSGTFPTNSWNHVVVTRSGANLRIFLNGVQLGTTNTALSTNSIDNASTLYYVGRPTDSGQLFTGYLSGTRVLVGTALYTQNFAPPIAPPTPITNTRLLLNYTNAGIVDSAGKLVWETVNNVYVSTLQSKFSGSSMYFDGESDNYLKANSTSGPLINARTGDWTWEAWVYHVRPISDAAQESYFSQDSTGHTITRQGTGKIDVDSNNGANLLRSNGTVPSNEWVHIATGRKGSILYLFINGVLDKSVSDTTDHNGSGMITVGANATAGAIYHFKGYMAEMRYTKGVARYTSNFIPQTSVWQNQ